LPEEFGQLVEVEGEWTLNGEPVVLAQHTNADGSVELWLSLASSPEWPLLVQHADGVWLLGLEEWTGEIMVVNTNEVPLQVKVIGFEGANGEELGSPEEELAPFAITTFASLPPGSYQMLFSFSLANPLELSCSLELSNDSRYEFIAVPEGIAVLEDDFTPQSGTEVDVLSSPLCGH
jgi:hypothetical protein